jgi:hypothetical protein
MTIPTTPRGVGGRIKFHLTQWESITSDPNILAIVQGVHFQFTGQPKQDKTPKEYCLKPLEIQALDQHIESMLKSKVITEVKPIQGQFVSPIFAKQETEKYRPIVNFKRLNAHIHYQKFKMETLTDVKNTIQHNDWLIKIDLKDAFLSVPIKETMTHLARFIWKGKLYQCLTLMFGMAPAPRLFTKLLKVPISVLRRLLIRLVIYIDDLLLMAQTIEEIEMARDTTLYLLQALGLTINWKKSILTPCKELIYLGVTINTTMMTFQVPQEKVSILKAMCQKALNTNRMTARKMASIMGKLRATAQAFSPAPLQLRNIQNSLKKALHRKSSYETTLKLNQGVRAELQWWLHNLQIHNGKQISMETPELTISSDSSSEGWGAHCLGQGASGKWNPQESKLHINIKELMAVHKAILTFTRIHKVSSIHMLIDNTTALSYLTNMGGRTNQIMNNLAKEIWAYLLKNKIQCTAEYIPTELNVEADRESRTTDSSEWKLNTKIFTKICYSLGQPSVDLFASLASHQLPKYMSYKPDPKAVAIDAFQHNWAHRLTYAFPPFNLIARTLKKVQTQRSSMIIVTPTWNTQPYWPLLLQMVIEQPILLPNRYNLLLDPAGNQHPLITNGNLRLAAWLVSGNLSKQREFHSKLPFSLNMQDPQALFHLMTQPGRNLIAGVAKGKLIQFTAM